MKQHILRIAVIGAVLVAGGVGLTQLNFGGNSDAKLTNTKKKKKEAVAKADKGTLTPIPKGDGEEGQGDDDELDPKLIQRRATSASNSVGAGDGTDGTDAGGDDSDSDSSQDGGSKYAAGAGGSVYGAPASRAMDGDGNDGSESVRRPSSRGFGDKTAQAGGSARRMENVYSVQDTNPPDEADDESAKTVNEEGGAEANEVEEADDAGSAAGANSRFENNGTSRGTRPLERQPPPPARPGPAKLLTATGIRDAGEPIDDQRGTLRRPDARVAHEESAIEDEDSDPRDEARLGLPGSRTLSTLNSPPEASRVGDTRSSPAVRPGNPRRPGALSGAPSADRSVSPSSHDMPGDHRLEGAQTPMVTIEKIAPVEVQVGQKANFEIRVRNIGQVAARDIIVSDRVPQGTEFAGSHPEVEPAADGTLTWELEQLKPGDEQTISVQLIPRTEGEIGSVATLGFRTHASVRTVSTRPQLTVRQSVRPAKVTIGGDVQLSITITNSGTGTATGVIVEEDVPEGFSHPAGRELERAVGTLRPNESRTFDLTLRATQAGATRNVLTVRSDSHEPITEQAEIEVTSPELQIAVNGPTRRYIERQVTHTIAVANPGSAGASHVQLAVRLPRGLKFVQADNQGRYAPQEHTVYWLMNELPPGKQGTVQLTTLPIEAGKQGLKIETQADLGLSARHEHTLTVESHATLVFSVTDLADPIEQGTDTTYVIEVKNASSERDRNVKLTVLLPPGLEYVDSSGPARATARETSQGEQLEFEPLPELAPKEGATFKVKVAGREEGDQKIRVSLSSDIALPTPVVKEESTRVYRDQ